MLHLAPFSIFPTNLLSKFDQLLIVATDERAFKKVEREIANAGLMGIDKIKIVLRDECR